MLKVLVAALSITACGLCHAAAQPAETGQSRFEEGLAAYNAGDVEAAKTSFARACDLDFSIGCFNLGVIYNTAEDSASNSAAAKEAFRKACESPAGPYYSGCFAYAQKLDRYGSEDYAPEEAGEYFAIACLDGDIYAACGRAASRLTGKLHKYIPPEDYARAATLRQKGCDGDSAESCWGLSNQYFSGWGVETNYLTSLQLIQKACTLDPSYGGEKTACDVRDSRLEEVNQKCTVGGVHACETLAAFNATGP